MKLGKDRENSDKIGLRSRIEIRDMISDFGSIRQDSAIFGNIRQRSTINWKFFDNSYNYISVHIIYIIQLSQISNNFEYKLNK